VDLARKLVVVEHDEAVVGVERLAEAVGEQGYEVEVTEMA
jgi:copper chaperone CopZ